MNCKHEKQRILLIGCGGHARSVVDAIEASGTYTIAGFIDREQSRFTYRGYEVIGCDADLPQLYTSGIHAAFICIGFMGKGRLRQQMAENLLKIGFELPVIADPTAILAADVEIAAGSFIGKRAVLNSNAKIGGNAIINTGAVVEHDCIVGDFSHISVGALLCGGVRVGENCLVGAGAVLIQEVEIGQNTVIGAGSTVIRNLAAGSRAAGSPAHEIGCGD